MTPADFAGFCREVHGWDPFPWQQKLLERVLERGWCRLADVPTALGKTGVLDIAVFAAALGAPAARRRIFFIVDRRLVVDEAYQHAREIAAALEKALDEAPGSVAGQVAAALHLPGDVDDPGGEPRRRVLDVTRMRGGASWSWRWLERPDRHAIVVGTVDQIGSRMFFRGYGLGPALRPIDAALVGTDSLIIVDEAHLSGPFLASVHDAFRTDTTPASCKPTVVSMTATPAAGADGVHSISQDDIGHPVAGSRLKAPKRLHPVTVRAAKAATGQAICEAMAEYAGHLAPGAGVVGVVCNTVARARAVFGLLSERHPGQCLLLTGRIRPVDRDYLLREWYPKIKAGRPADLEEPVFLVATQTVEVGANIGLDALVTDSASLPALVQRLGRLNRLEPHRPVTHAVVLHRDDDPPGVYGDARGATWKLLTELTPPAQFTPGRPLPDLGPGLPASPLALRGLAERLPGSERSRLREAAPYVPVMFPAHLDTWARTSPAPRTDVPVAPFLHGIDSAPPDVTVIWRELPADKDGQVLAVQVLPPSADEGIELPAWAVRRWLAGIDTAAGLADLEGTAPPDTPGTGAAGGPEVVRYQDRDSARHVRAGEIRPADLIVVPASYGGCDRYGWNPASTAPVTDVADLAGSGGRQATIRLAPVFLRAVAGHDPDFAQRLQPLIEQAEGDLAGDDLKDAREYRDKIREILPASSPRRGLLPPHLTILGRLAASRFPALDVHRQFGWAVLTGDKTAYADDSAAQSSSVAGQPAGLMTHQRDVQACAHLFARNLGLDDAAVTAVGLAALWHDEGKRDPRFQAMLHGGDRIAAAVADSPLAKSGFSPLDRHAFIRARERAGYPRGMRHEALSAQIAAHFLAGRDDVDHDLVLHLIASHHGRSRPLLPPAADPAPVTTIGAPEWAGELPVDTGRPVEWSAPARFARLNARYGRWGLARMEAVVRLADIWCSARGKPPGPPAGQAAPVSGLPAGLAQDVPDAVELPALDGRDPLGFLAALGLVRILTETAGIPARLSFSPDSGCAVLWSELTTTGEISEILTRVVKGIPPGAVLPLAGPGFPPPSGTGKDPLRPSRSGYRTMTASFNETDLEVISAWLPCLVTDLAADRQGRAALTPFTAPSGQQKVRTFFEKPLRAVAAAPRSLYEALTGWRRIDGFTGEYLDHRVLRSAADDVEGRPGQEAGVPGATWLATMALPLLSHTGDGTRPRTVLWYRNEGSDMMMWPLWREPLDPHAIKCLLDHPALQQAAKPGNSQNLAPLGVFAVCGAERQRIPGRNFDGVLTPITALIR